MEEEIVLAFIGRFQNEGTIKAFTDGCCYWFAFILAQRFLLSEIAYNPVLNHFAVRIGTDLYDITGKIETSEGPWIDWDEYQAAEPADTERVQRYCIDKTE